MNLDQAIAKVREVALDLREPQAGANLSHQADKLDRVVAALEIHRDRLDELLRPGDAAQVPDNVTKVHGGGTGNE